MDLKVANTGNATAYDISVLIDPPIAQSKPRSSSAILPFECISILKPGDELSSYITEYQNVKGVSYTVTISWRRSPDKVTREKNVYTLNMADLEGITRLGGGDPLVQVAVELKHMREDWRWVAKGSRKLAVNVYTSADRLHERRQHERQVRHERRTAAAMATEPEAGRDGGLSDSEPGASG